MSSGNEQDSDAGIQTADTSASGRQTASADALGIGGDYGDAVSGLILFVAVMLGLVLSLFGFSLYKRFKVAQTKALYKRKVKELREQRRNIVRPIENVPEDKLPPTGTWSLRYKDGGGLFSEPVVKGGSCVLIFRDDGTIAGDGHDATGLYKLEGLYNCNTGVMHIGGTYPEMRGERFISEMVGQGYTLPEGKSKPPRMRPGKANSIEIPQGGSDIHRIIGRFHSSAGLSGKFTLELTGDLDYYKVDISGWDTHLKVKQQPSVSRMFTALNEFTTFSRSLARNLTEVDLGSNSAADAFRKLQDNFTSLAGVISGVIPTASADAKSISGSNTDDEPHPPPTVVEDDSMDSTPVLEEFGGVNLMDLLHVLPPYWEGKIDLHSGKLYYVNTITHEMQWEPPIETPQRRTIGKFRVPPELDAQAPNPHGLPNTTSGVVTKEEVELTVFDECTPKDLPVANDLENPMANEPEQPVINELEQPVANELEHPVVNVLEKSVDNEPGNPVCDESELKPDKPKLELLSAPLDDDHELEVDKHEEKIVPLTDECEKVDDEPEPVLEE